MTEPAPMPEPRARAHDGNTQRVAMSRDIVAKAKRYANANNFTIRSVIECAVQYYLHLKNGHGLEPKQTAVDVSVDGGVSWSTCLLENPISAAKTSGPLKARNMTYQRDSDTCRSPFRWRPV